MAENGKLSPSELSPIPGGELDHDAAAAWNAPGGPASAGLRPTGSRSSYRTFDEQVFFWNNQPPLAARPGTSNHGWGLAVDLAETWMRSWIDDHGARFGWRKTEAFSEWWHVNYDGTKHFPTFAPLHGAPRRSRGRRVRFYTKRLAFIRRQAGHGKTAPYLGHWYWRYKDQVVEAVKDFQRAQGLAVDGVIGEETAHRISAVFHKQYVHRHGRRKRRLRDAVRRRP